jgi:hypothetical protein
MTNRTRSEIVILMLVYGATGCGESAPPASPTSPSSVTSPTNVGEPIQGVVYDSGLRPIAGARVEFLDGPQTGVSTTAGSDGGFTLSGTVDDTTRFRASKDGHVAGTATIQPSCDRCNPRRWVYFYLDVLEPPVAIAGDYTLTFTADSACASLPDELRNRSYTVTIAPADLNWPGYPAQSATSFKITPRGSAFPTGLNHFYLNVAGSYVNVSLGDHTDPGVTERIDANTYFAFGGWAVTSAATPVSTIFTTFDGWIDSCVNPDMGDRYDCTPGPTVTRVRCESKKHQLMLTRR